MVLIPQVEVVRFRLRILWRPSFAYQSCPSITNRYSKSRTDSFSFPLILPNHFIQALSHIRHTHSLTMPNLTSLDALTVNTPLPLLGPHLPAFVLSVAACYAIQYATYAFGPSLVGAGKWAQLDRRTRTESLTRTVCEYARRRISSAILCSLSASDCPRRHRYPLRNICAELQDTPGRSGIWV